MGNVINRSSINIALFNTNYIDEIKIFVLLIQAKSFGVICSFGKDFMGIYVGGRHIPNRQELPATHINHHIFFY